MSDVNTGNPLGVSMNSLPSSVRARYLAQVAYWTNTLTSLDTLYTQLMGSTTEEYDFSGGEGRQKVKRKSLAEVGDEIRFAEARLRFYEQRLYGRGVMSMRMRRS